MVAPFDKTRSRSREIGPDIPFPAASSSILVVKSRNGRYIPPVTATETTKSSAVLNTRGAIKRELLRLAYAGKFFPLDTPRPMNSFLGSVDRFSEIIEAFQGRERVIDIGAGGGVLI